MRPRELHSSPLMGALGLLLILLLPNLTEAQPFEQDVLPPDFTLFYLVTSLAPVAQSTTPPLQSDQTSIEPELFGPLATMQP